MNEPKTELEIEELNGKISDGLDQLDRGEGIPGEFARLETLKRRQRVLERRPRPASQD
jgi:hypothetical protein